MDIAVSAISGTADGDAAVQAIMDFFFLQDPAFVRLTVHSYGVLHLKILQLLIFS
jgi:hypothetical protein